MKVLPAVLSSCFKSKYLDEKFKTDVYKVIEIWKKREVFSKVKMTFLIFIIL